MLTKIETTLERAVFVEQCTTVPALRIGSALLLDGRHADACLYLAGGKLRTPTDYDRQRYEQEPT